MKKIANLWLLLFVISSSFLSIKTFAQNAMVWQKCFGCPQGNRFKNMCKISDGGYLLLGTFDLAGGDFNGHYDEIDIGLIKIDSNGNKLWSTYYGSEDIDDALSLIKGYNNHYYIVGITEHFGFPGFHGVPELNNHADGYVICIDENGGVIWQHCYGGYGIDWLYTGVVMDSTYLYIAGNTKKSNGGDTGGNYNPDTTATATDDIFVCKIRASDGSLIHSKRFGGTDNESVHKMMVTRTGNLLLLGSSKSNDIDVPVNYGYMDAWALLTDTAFNIISSKIFGGAKFDEFFDAIHLPNGDYMLYGYTKNTDTLIGNLNVTITSGNEQFLLIKTDSNFVPLWQKTYGCDYSNYPYQGSDNFVQTADQGFIIGGRAVGSQSCNPTPFTTGHSIFIKVDSSGNKLFEKHYGSGLDSGSVGGGAVDVVRSIKITNEGEIIVGSIGHADANNTCNTPGINPMVFWNIYKLDNTWGIDQNENYVQPTIVYPNPASTEINICTGMFETGTRLYLQMYDIQGRLAMQITLVKGNEDVQADIGRLQKGLYLGRLTDDKGRAVSFKILKE